MESFERPNILWHPRAGGRVRAGLSRGRRSLLNMKTAHSMTMLLAVLAGAAHAQTTEGSLERELLADAGSRTSFQAGGTGGHDGKFFVASADGSFRLNVGGQTQFRYNMNSRDVDDPDEEFSNGFTMRRM